MPVRMRGAEIELLATHKIKVDKTLQLRDSYPEERLGELRASMQLNGWFSEDPAKITESGTIIDGATRLGLAKELKIGMVPVIRVKCEDTASHLLRQLLSFLREDLSPLARAKAIRRYVEFAAKKDSVQHAALTKEQLEFYLAPLGISSRAYYANNQVLNNEEVLHAVEKGDISMNQARIIVQAPPEEQSKLLFHASELTTEELIDNVRESNSEGEEGETTTEEASEQPENPESEAVEGETAAIEQPTGPDKPEDSPNDEPPIESQPEPSKEDLEDEKLDAETINRLHKDWNERFKIKKLLPLRLFKEGMFDFGSPKALNKTIEVFRRSAYQISKSKFLEKMNGKDKDGKDNKESYRTRLDEIIDELKRAKARIK